jgi:hypothetical protein
MDPSLIRVLVLHRSDHWKSDICISILKSKIYDASYDKCPRYVTAFHWFESRQSWLIPIFNCSKHDVLLSLLLSNCTIELLFGKLKTIWGIEWN